MIGTGLAVVGGVAGGLAGAASTQVLDALVGAGAQVHGGGVGAVGGVEGLALGTGLGLAVEIYHL